MDCCLETMYAVLGIGIVYVDMEGILCFVGGA